MTAAAFHQRAGDARYISPVGFWGGVLTNDRVVDGVNSGGQANDTWTIAIPASPDNSTEYTVTINGIACSYTTDASATTAELGAGLVAAINAAPGARGAYVPSFASTTLTLTAVYPGIAGTVAASGGSGGGAIGTPSNSVPAASADTIEFGRALISLSADKGAAQVQKPSSSALTAQVQSHTITSAASALFSGTVAINGKVYEWGPVAHNTDSDTTAGDIRTAINAAVPAETVLAGGATNVVTLTAEVEGAEFDADIVVSGSASAASAKVYTTGPSAATSLARSLYGASVRRLDVENLTLTGGDPEYAANAVVECLRRGTMRVQRDTSETISPGDEVYVSIASATAGRFYKSAGTDRVWLPPSVAVWAQGEDSSTSDGIAVVQINAGS
jgi:hypothetical protein